MDTTLKFMLKIAFFALLLVSQVASALDEVKVPILAYHRFGSSVKDEMTIKTSDFAAQLKWLKDNGYTVVPLKAAMNAINGTGAPLPPKAVVITADDGHISVYTDMLPLVEKYKIPVTLFIYPSAISHASYAMTWEQLQKLQQTGLFDIQGHTYWHPNFKKEKKRLSDSEYQKFVETQLTKSKNVLENKLNIKVEYLAWPFGIYNDELEKAAHEAGYTAAFSIDARNANKSENMMSQPRFMIVNDPGLKRWASIAPAESKQETHAENEGNKK